MTANLAYRNAGNVTLLDLMDAEPGRALDCGCGAGDNARILRARGWRVTGVTIDPVERSVALQSCAEVILADLTQGLPFAEDSSYDLVVLSHVLEHLADPAALLAEAARVLVPHGVVAVALPNVLHYRQRAEFLRGRFDYTPTGVMDATHLRFFTFDGAARLLTTNGFAIIARRGDGGLPWWRLRALLPGQAIHCADRWAARRWPNLLCWQGVFVARLAR